MSTEAATASPVDGPAAWLRLVAALALSTLGGVGMWSMVVALPAVQADFGVDRAAATVPYTLAMIGFGIGGIFLGRLTDRFGIALPMAGAALCLGFGIVSRLLSGWIADRIGGLRTLLLGSALQGLALLLYIPLDGLQSLYLVSALFGLFQGGIVPS